MAAGASAKRGRVLELRACHWIELAWRRLDVAIIAGVQRGHVAAGLALGFHTIVAAVAGARRNIGMVKGQRRNEGRGRVAGFANIAGGQMRGRWALQLAHDKANRTCARGDHDRTSVAGITRANNLCVIRLVLLEARLEGRGGVAINAVVGCVDMCRCLFQHSALEHSGLRAIVARQAGACGLRVIKARSRRKLGGQRYGGIVVAGDTGRGGGEVGTASADDWASRDCLTAIMARHAGADEARTCTMINRDHRFEADIGGVMAGVAGRAGSQMSRRTRQRR